MALEVSHRRRLGDRGLPRARAVREVGGHQLGRRRTGRHGRTVRGDALAPDALRETRRAARVPLALPDEVRRTVIVDERLRIDRTDRIRARVVADEWPGRIVDVRTERTRRRHGPTDAEA